MWFEHCAPFLDQHFVQFSLIPSSSIPNISCAKGRGPETYAVHAGGLNLNCVGSSSHVSSRLYRRFSRSHVQRRLASIVQLFPWFYALSSMVGYFRLRVQYISAGGIPWSVWHPAKDPPGVVICGIISSSLFNDTTFPCFRCCCDFMITSISQS